MKVQGKDSCFTKIEFSLVRGSIVMFDQAASQTEGCFDSVQSCTCALFVSVSTVAVFTHVNRDDLIVIIDNDRIDSSYELL